MDGLPCSAGHTACYISPYGDVFPCVQFPLAQRQPAAAEVCGYLAELVATERSPFDPCPRFADLFDLRPRGNLYALSRSRVYGREYARAIHRRLRKVLSANRHPVCEYVVAPTSKFFGSVDSNPIYGVKPSHKNGLNPASCARRSPTRNPFDHCWLRK